MNTNNIFTPKIIASTVAAVTLTTFIGVKLYGESVAEEELQTALNNSGYANFVQYKDVSFNPLTFSTSINNLSIGVGDEKWAKFDSFTINDFDEGEDSFELDIEFDLAEMPIESLPRSFRALSNQAKSLGLETIDGGGALYIELDESEFESGFEMYVDDVASIELSSELEVNLTDDQISAAIASLMLYGANPRIMTSYSNEIAIDEFYFEYEDEGILQNYVDTLDEDSLESDLVLKDILDTVANYGLANKESSTAEDIAEELLGFIKSPSELSISITPDDPMSLNQMFTYSRSNSLYDKSNMDISN